MKILRVLRGLATYIPGLHRISAESGKGTVSARYCYSVWLRHLVMAHRSSLSVHPEVVAELGPGDSLGVGLAALLSGASRYFAFDVVRYAHNETNSTVFEELIRLFRARERIPDEAEYPKVEPRLESYEFPHGIMTERRLTEALAEDRLRAIRDALRSENGGALQINYFAPWYDLAALAPASVDMILSQAVLEYVDNLPQAYAAFYRWLAPGGMASLVIDYKSHGIAETWDGHWAYSDLAWRLMRGKRSYYLNREPHSTHARLLQAAGLTLVREARTGRPPETPRGRLAARFRGMSEQDRTTASAFIQAVKNRGELEVAR
ncbi:MAG: methyltransferase domain-containing protein [Planctomycetes bacterium]|nr:methyltransferase domain-containing protein [Planctomycetota bacterium]